MHGQLNAYVTPCSCVIMELLSAIVTHVRGITHVPDLTLALLRYRISHSSRTCRATLFLGVKENIFLSQHADFKRITYMMDKTLASCSSASAHAICVSMVAALLDSRQRTSPIQILTVSPVTVFLKLAGVCFIRDAMLSSPLGTSCRRPCWIHRRRWIPRLPYAASRRHYT